VSQRLHLKPNSSLVKRPRRKKYALEQLVSKIIPGNRHYEMNWGGKKGKEVW